MDRETRLRDVCRQAHELGQSLLPILREGLSEAALERIHQLVGERETALGVAMELFQPGDEERLAADLSALAQQQQVLETEMARVLDTLRQACREIDGSKSTVQSSRRLMDSSRSGRLVDKIL